MQKNNLQKSDGVELNLRKHQPLKNQKKIYIDLTLNKENILTPEQSTYIKKDVGVSVA